MFHYAIGTKIAHIEVIGERIRGTDKCLCRCRCGKEWSVSVFLLRNGDTKSCGCWRVENTRRLATTHGMTPRGRPPPEYICWGGMIQRCCNPKSPAYRYYGARGITVCDRWRSSFKDFFADMGVRPKGMTLEREDNSLGYQPGNCVWATRHQQMCNTRQTKLVVVDGVSMTTKAAAAAIGVPMSRVYGRVFRSGCSHQQAVDFCRAQASG